MMPHEVMEFDVVIVGAGPSGLSAAIKLKQLALTANTDLRVCVLEKGSSVGANVLSGAVLDPRTLRELLPDTWHEAPFDTAVSEDFFYLLTQRHAYRLPTPAPMKNHGNHMISLGLLCQFLALQAEQLGCEIYPGFPAAEILYDAEGHVMGVTTGEVGLDHQGQPTSQYQPGLHLHAKQTLFAEGCRGQLSQSLMARYRLRDGVSPQTYGLGLKEIWTVSPTQHHLGRVVHTVGWPLDQGTYGGAFLYYMSENRVAMGFVVGLDYRNPWLSPFEEFQRFKTHPMIREVLTGGERLEFGARCLNEGGWQSLPKLTFPGGMLIGDAAGFLNVPKIKGIHTAMASGMYAAQACFNMQPLTSKECVAYATDIKTSWVAKELYAVRNVRPGFRWGLWVGLAMAAFETYITRGHEPWTLNNHDDHLMLKHADQVKKKVYPKPDGVLTFDRLSSVYLSNTFHSEQQPCHLKIRNPALLREVNERLYASPETRYCPAAVYELDHDKTPSILVIHAQNCLHCKACDIKDPCQNIVWTAPEGGGGPSYVRM